MSRNPYEATHVADSGDRVSKTRTAIVVTSYLLMAIVAGGFVFGIYHDWSRVGFQLPHRAVDWFLVTVWFADIFAFYGIARGVHERRSLLTAVSFIPILVSIVFAASIKA